MLLQKAFLVIREIRHRELSVCAEKKQVIEIVFFALRPISEILQTQVFRASCFRAMKSIGIWGIKMNVFIHRFWIVAYSSVLVKHT